ncbi:MAG: hypothetical protein R2843_00245 [Thermomicrobiales bacterium]
MSDLVDVRAFVERHALGLRSHAPLDRTPHTVKTAEAAHPDSGSAFNVPRSSTLIGKCL